MRGIVAVVVILLTVCVGSALAEAPISKEVCTVMCKDRTFEDVRFQRVRNNPVEIVVYDVSGKKGICIGEPITIIYNPGQ